MASSAFERFRYSFFEDAGSVRDGLDTKALLMLEGDERIRAEDMLLQYLPDARGVIGLGVLRSQRAEPVLVQLFEAERDTGGLRMQTYIATALMLIRPNPRWLEQLIETLASAEDWTERIAAAIALHESRDASAKSALVKALDDPDGLVRHHAASGLLVLHGLPNQVSDFEHFIYRVMSDDIDLREGGKKDLLAAIAGRPIAAPSFNS